MGPAGTTGTRVAVLLLAAALAAASPADAGGIQVAGVPARAGFVVEEYRLVECSVDSPTHVEFARSVLDSVRTKREAARSNQPLFCDVDKIDRELAPQGFCLRRVEWPTRSTPSYDFLKGDSVVLPLLSDILFVNDPGTGRFLFTATQDRQTGPPWCDYWLILDGEPRPWMPWDHEYRPPLLLRGELVTLDVEPADSGRTRLTVSCGDSVAYSVLTGSDVCAGTVDGFLFDGQDWVLEYADTVVRGGADLGRRLGCDAVFHYRVIDGSPFYFFVRDGSVSMSHNGIALPQVYDDVYRGGGSEAAAGNPQSNDDMVWFYARRDGWWYYVEAGVFD